jgi:hypothetical protein
VTSPSGDVRVPCSGSPLGAGLAGVVAGAVAGFVAGVVGGLAGSGETLAGEPCGLDGDGDVDAGGEGPGVDVGDGVGVGVGVTVGVAVLLGAGVAQPECAGLPPRSPMPASLSHSYPLFASEPLGAWPGGFLSSAAPTVPFAGAAPMPCGVPPPTSAGAYGFGLEPFAPEPAGAGEAAAATVTAVALAAVSSAAAYIVKGRLIAATRQAATSIRRISTGRLPPAGARRQQGEQRVGASQLRGEWRHMPPGDAPGWGARPTLVRFSPEVNDHL